jgi:hypothetical protein
VQSCQKARLKIGKFFEQFQCGAPIKNQRQKWRRKMEQIGYARVSTDGQSVAAQVEALQAIGCSKVFAENISGVVTDSKELAKAIKALCAGDVLVVCKIDRLARSLRDLLNVLQIIADKSAGFKVLDNPALDTTNAYGALLLNAAGVLGAIADAITRTGTEQLGANLGPNDQSVPVCSSGESGVNS